MQCYGTKDYGLMCWKLKTLWKWLFVFSQSVMVCVSRQYLVLHCDWLIAPLDKNSSQFSQFMVLAGSDT